MCPGVEDQRSGGIRESSRKGEVGPAAFVAPPAAFVGPFFDRGAHQDAQPYHALSL